jgi:hypothetical protein
MNERFRPAFFQSFFFFFLFLLLSLSACHKDDDTIETFQGKTVLVYMVADNSLSSEADDNIDSIEAGLGRNTINGNLLVYVDNYNGNPRLIHIVKSGNGTVTQQTVKTYSEQNSVSPTVMSSVLKDVTNCFPSTSYGLVLWSHGYGWLPATSSSKAVTATSARTVSLRWFGLDGTNEMNISDLVTALNAGPHFDYILFDACFMGGVETAYALRGCADYLIASPTEVLSDGFPYSEIVPYMVGSTRSDYIKMASLYYDHYSTMTGYNRSAAVGCIKCSELDGLASETKALISTHTAELDSFDVSTVQYLEAYTPHLFYDFGNFVENFTTEQQRYYFEQQLSKTIIYKACTDSILSVDGSGFSHYLPIVHFSGLNTYIPSTLTATRNASYQTLAWYTAAGWDRTKW